MSGFEEVVGARGMLVKMGLAQPESRAFVVGGFVGAAMYALGLPKQAFTEDGEMRPNPQRPANKGSGRQGQGVS